MDRGQLSLPVLVHGVHRRPAPQSEEELLLRARALAGHSVADLCCALKASLPADPKRAKGFVGQLVEWALGSDPSAGERPDFVALGVELKTIPVDPRGWPVEATFCCSIHMASADIQTWENARLRRRLACVLWVPVESGKGASWGQRRFLPPTLWRPSVAQSAQLRADWEDLMGAIGAGQQSLLGGHDGVVLQVRPKAANSAVRTLAAAGDGLTRAPPLGFYLRPGFTGPIVAAGVQSRA